MAYRLTAPPRLPLIAPSILSADFAHMASECRTVLEGGADMLHLDVMDGHFVPNLTMGPDMCRALRRAFPDTILDVHLMVTDPAPHADAFVRAGASHVTFHAEVMDPAAALALATRLRSQGVSAGIAINPPTPVERILPLAAEFELILVMSVNPGFSGQKLIPETVAKSQALRPRLRPDQRLQMDGGITVENANAVRAAGCDVLVAASAVFGAAPDARPGIIEALRGTSKG